MPVKLVLGLQHGDEGKGRVVDDLVESWADVVIRFQGGGNAGHTVYDREGNKFVTHILPVGILNKSKLNIVARGCVLNVKDLYEELKEFDIKPEKLTISGFCPLIEPTHILKDRLLYQGKLGTTARGIGPAYSDFYARDSILFKDFVENPDKTLVKIQRKFLKFMKETTEDVKGLTAYLNSNQKIVDEYFEFFNDWTKNYQQIANHVSKFIMDDESLILDLYDEGKNILLEGAQGCGLNVHSNNYPDVTSSAPTIGGALNSTGLNHKQIDEVIGVTKAYKTKVGTGEFPSKCDKENGETLARIGNEYGATTGRPRKCGWLDIDELNQSIRMNGVDHLCLIKTDVFTNIKNPFVYYKKKNIPISKVNDVSLKDKSFVELLNIIKDKTGVNVISFTSGPKRGQIHWDKKL